MGLDPTRPLYTTDDEGATTDATMVSSVSSKASSHKRGSRGKKKAKSKLVPPVGIDSDSGASATFASMESKKKKKAGINTKVTIPEFGGKAAHPHDTVEAFRRWARTVACHREYYEDKYLMSQIIASLKDDAARMFDFVCRNNPGADLGLIIEKLRHHYCGMITFSEQRNTVENLRQGSKEEATDFLVQVGDAAENLGKDWKGVLSPLELEAMQYTVSLNGVGEDIRHVLNAETSRHGRLTAQQMYDAVRNHEAYVSHNKCLQGSSPYTGCPQVPRAPQGSSYKPRFQKTTAFAAALAEPQLDPGNPEPHSLEKEDSAEPDPQQEESGGVYIPDFLSRATDAHW